MKANKYWAVIQVDLLNALKFAIALVIVITVIAAAILGVVFVIMLVCAFPAAACTVIAAVCITCLMWKWVKSIKRRAHNPVDQ